MSYTTLKEHVQAQTLEPEHAAAAATFNKVKDVSKSVSEGVSDALQIASDAIVLGLDTAWAAVSVFKPAHTDYENTALGKVLSKISPLSATIESSTDKDVDRFDRDYLYSLKLGDYFMPMSNSFSLRAKKRLNVSSLVDGIDVIQQTRKEPKTIDCTLRITLRSNQPNLEIVDEVEASKGSNAQSFKRQNHFGGKSIFSTFPVEYTGVEDIASTDDKIRSIATLGEMLQNLYEADAVFEIDNKMINDVFGVRTAIISEYKFTPRVGYGTFDISMALTEVITTKDLLIEPKTTLA